jgi:hypothetical protein
LENLQRAGTLQGDQQIAERQEDQKNIQQIAEGEVLQKLQYLLQRSSLTPVHFLGLVPLSAGFTKGGG